MTAYKEYLRLEAMTFEEREAEIERLLDGLKNQGAVILPSEPSSIGFIGELYCVEEAEIIRDFCAKKTKCKKCPYESNLEKGECMFKEKPKSWAI